MGQTLTFKVGWMILSSQRKSETYTTYVLFPYSFNLFSKAVDHTSKGLQIYLEGGMSRKTAAPITHCNAKHSCHQQPA